MSSAAPRVEIAVRPYRDEDEPEVLDLLNASLGGGPAGKRPAEFFRWKHVESPFGRSFMLVAVDAGRIVGLRAFMRWRFGSGDRTVRAVRAVDTATHPDCQGRGIFSRLTLEALDALRGDTDLVFNTPNEKSLPGYLKMGWRTVGKMPISVRVRRPVRFLSRMRSARRTADSDRRTIPVAARPAAEVLKSATSLPSLLTAAEIPAARLVTPRDLDYLSWRYGAAPLLDYRAVLDERDGLLGGVAFFRARPRGDLREATIAELIVRPGDTAAGRRLLRAVVRAAEVDHLTCHVPAGSTAARAARTAGFIRSRDGMMLVVNLLRDDLRPDPMQPASWGLSLGDLEVF